MSPPVHAVLTQCRIEPGRMKPGQAAELVRRLGELASWWLHPDVLALAARALRIAWPRRSLPTSAGSCWIVFAQHSSMPWPALREAFLLPLQWRENTADSQQLPDKLRRLARLAAQCVHHPNWGLHLSQDAGLAQHNLSQLDDHLDVDSGWAALACGLLLAAEGGTPDPDVWASGCWDPDGGVTRVGDLPAKLRLAAEWGASTFFLPAFQLEEAKAWLLGPSTLQLCPLRAGTCDPMQALADYLYRLDAPPPPPTSVDDEPGFTRCATYYLRQPLHAASTQEYYRTALLPCIVHRQSRHVGAAYPGWRPTHLVTIVSGSDVLVELMARALRVSHVLLLHTPDQRQLERTETVRSRLEQAGISCVTRRIHQEGMLVDVRRSLEQFDGVDASQIVFDLTPGTKLMTYALARAAPEGSWLVYLEHAFREGRPQPGTERLIRWLAGA